MNPVKNPSQKIIFRFALVVFSLTALIYSYPLMITFTNSFMSGSEIMGHYAPTAEDGIIEMNLIPDSITFQQYNQILFQTPFYLNMFWNSLKITVPVVLGQLIVSATAAYAFTVLQFKYKERLFFIYIVVMLLPLQVTLMPNYVIADALHMTDSYLAIILPGIFNPFGTFLLRQFMKSIPKAYLESAQIDGAGHLRIFFSIVLPMVKSGIAAVAMLTFVEYWNLIDQAVIFIQDKNAQPLSLFLANINQSQIGISFASSCFYVIPVLIILYYGQDYLKEGIGLSGLKG